MSINIKMRPSIRSYCRLKIFVKSRKLKIYCTKGSNSYKNILLLKINPETCKFFFFISYLNLLFIYIALKNKINFKLRKKLHQRISIKTVKPSKNRY